MAVKAASASSSFVFDDALRWDNWSWNTTLDPNAAAPGGTKSLGITFTAGYAGAFFAKTGFDTTPFTNLSFMIHGASLAALRVYLVDATGANLTFVDPSAYATASSEGWYSVAILLSALSGSAKTLTGVVLHEFSGAAQPTFYVKNLAFNGAPQSPSVSASASSSFVYDDALRWDNWSWNTTLDPNAAAPGGKRSLGITFTAGYAGAFFAKTGFDTTPFTNLSFMIHGASLAALRVYLVDATGANLTFVDPSPYATASSEGWYSVTIPLSALSGSAKALTGVVLHEFSGAAQPTFYVKNLSFNGTPQSMSTSGSGRSSFVYDDALRWDNWSWNTTLDPNAPAVGGTKSLGITFTAGYAGAFFAKTGFDTTPFTNLSFMIHGASLPALRVYLVDSTGANLTFVDPSAYATASSEGWYSVAIPLSALSGSSKTLTGIVLHEFSGAAQPTFYVANLAFASDPQSSASAPQPQR